MKKLFKNFGIWLRRYSGIEKDGKTKHGFAAFLFWAIFRTETFPEGVGRMIIGRSWIPFGIQGWIIQGFSEQSKDLREERAKTSHIVDANSVVAQADVIDGGGDYITKEALANASGVFNYQVHRPVLFAFHEANPAVGFVVSTKVEGNFLYAEVKLNKNFPSVKDLLENHSWTLRPAYKILESSMIDLQGQRARRFDKVEIISLSLVPTKSATALKGPKRG